LQESTIHRRRERLNKITDGLGLGDAYDATIERIRAQDGDKSGLGIGALLWVCHAQRPLKVDELCYALAVELGSTDFNSHNVPSVSTLVSCCQGLISVDKEASTVRLVHFTLKEYLFARPDIFGGHHSIMAEICLTYLNSEKVKALSTDPSRIRGTPFLQYCSVYWGVHAERGSSNHVRSLTLELLHDYDSHISARSLLASVRHLGDWRPGMSFQFSGLHCASYFGIEEGVIALIGMEGYDINKGDFLGNTPLAWAALKGHEGVVKILLRQAEVNPDKPDNYGNTPLRQAACRGYEGVVKVLLERGDVDPERPDYGGLTPLQSAAQHGHEGVVKVLLERGGVDPNKLDCYGQTVLLRATCVGYEKVVKILLSQVAVNPDKPDHHGSTPLLVAAQYGYESIVEMLLGREEVNHEKRDNDGDTPLSCAAGYGREGVIKMLLEKERVNLDNINHAGQTPLMRAVRQGNRQVIERLKLHQATTCVTASGSGGTAR